MRVQGQQRVRANLNYFEVFVNIAIGGIDIDIPLILNTMFIQDNFIVMLCFVESNGTLTHSHFANGCQWKL